MVTWVLVAILILVNILLAFQRVSNALVGLLGAILVIVVGYLSGLFNFIGALSFIDFNAIFLILGLFILIQVTKDNGLFQFITLKIVKKTGGRVYPLYISFIVLTFLLAGLVGSITTMMIVGYITIITSSTCDYDPTPFLIIESFIADMAGTTLVSGSVSIIVASQLLGITYAEWASIAYPMGLVFLGFSILIAPKLQRRNLKAQKTSMEALYELELIDPWQVVNKKSIFYATAGVLAFTFIMFFLSSFINVSLGFIALLSALIMLIINRADLQHVFQKTDWETLIYIIGISITIGGVSESGILDILGNSLFLLIGGNAVLGLVTILWVISALTGFLDNLAVTLMFIPTIKIFSATIPLLPMAYALLLGADIGITFLPWATTSGLIAMSLAKEANAKIKVKDYAKVGLLNICYLSIATLLFTGITII
ncbi:MAG: anion permease [Candidatus Odinarchaeum yellowstonii]|uniref:Anion permease n=1 Tax=Odinarchaeota yellowstonii (strain LCB_4) TaxID=1841599 RepID=A0AAF0D396_ODILC|nr:MAG: anion permease [Candidatus Odinarchaeum yellowstonii]